MKGLFFSKMKLDVSHKGRRVNGIALVLFLLCVNLTVGQGVNALTDKEKKIGYTTLFDGTLESVKSHWTSYKKGNKTIDVLPGNIIVDSSDDGKGNFFGKISNAKGDDIRTKKKYSHFEITFQYRISSNSGFFYRADVLTKVMGANTSEFQLLDDLTKANPYRTNVSGAIYDVYVPYVEEYETWASGKWNTGKVIGRGDSIYQYHQGKLVGQYDGNGKEFKDIISGRIVVPGTVDDTSKAFTRPCYTVVASSESACKHSNPYRDTGYFGFQIDHGGQVRIRGVKLLDLASGCKNSGYEEYYSEFMTHDSTRCKTLIDVSIEKGKSNNLGKVWGSLLIDKAGINLKFNELEDVNLQLLELSGKLIQEVDLAIESSSNYLFRTNVKGMYLLRVYSKKHKFTEKVLLY